MVSGAVRAVLTATMTWHTYFGMNAYFLRALIYNREGSSIGITQPVDNRRLFATQVSCSELRDLSLL
jgi:hypothetical protein